MAIPLIDSLRSAISYAERLENAELLAKFRSALLDGQDLIDANLNLRDENRELKDKVKDLESRLKFQDELVFIAGLFHVTDSGGLIGEPYCPTCWESKNLAVHLHWDKNAGYVCNVCKSGFSYNHRNPALPPENIDPNYRSRPTAKQLADNSATADG